MFRHFLVSFFVLACLTLSTQAQFRPLLITLDHNDDFVITGLGQTIGGVEFMDPNGGFEPAPGSLNVIDLATGEFEGSAPAPFQFAIEVSPSQVTYGMLPVMPIVGSYPMGFGPTDLSALSDVQILVASLGSPHNNPMNLTCDGCKFPNVSFNTNGGIEIANINDPILNLTLYAEDGGLQVNGVPLDIAIVDASPTQLTLTSTEAISPDVLAGLEVVQSVGSTGAVFAEFTLANETTFGPFAVAAIPEPSGTQLFLLGVIGFLAFRQTRRAAV